MSRKTPHCSRDMFAKLSFWVSFEKALYKINVGSHAVFK